MFFLSMLVSDERLTACFLCVILGSEIPVHKGDFIQIDSETVHVIKGAFVICISEFFLFFGNTEYNGHFKKICGYHYYNINFMIFKI